MWYLATCRKKSRGSLGPLKPSKTRVGVQVSQVTSIYGAMFVPTGQDIRPPYSKTGFYAWPQPTRGLDTSFPYDNPLPNPGFGLPGDIWNSDSPGWPIAKGGFTWFVHYYTTWLYCRPTPASNTGPDIWVPVAKFSWNVAIFAEWPGGNNNDPKILYSTHLGNSTPNANGIYTFKPTTQFAQWNGVVKTKSIPVLQH